MTRTDRLLADFAPSESRPMIAAALEILGGLADSPSARENILAPWAWDLRQQARQLEKSGVRGAAAEAKAIARVVSATALGELSSDELAAASRALQVDEQARLAAVGVLRVAMQS